MHPECAIPITSWYDDMDDTELYLLTPILESLSKLDDVRTVIKSIVFEDKVLFNKASQILKGGKLGERSQSQKPTIRGLKQTNEEYLAGMNLSQQSGDINEEDEESKSNQNDSNIKNSNEPALSYFKCFQEINRKSRTGSKTGTQKRGGSQKRNHHNDPNQIHFMPKVDSMQLHPHNTIKNGWISKIEKDPAPTLSEPLTLNINRKMNKSRNNFSGSPSIIHKSRNNMGNNYSSAIRTYRKKGKHEITPLNRYQNLSNRNSGEFRTVRRKRELMLFSINKNSRSNSKPDNKFKNGKNSPEKVHLKSKLFINLHFLIILK